MRAAAAFLALLAFAGASHAEPFASRPIRILVGVPPGATTDYLARLVAQEIARDTGQSAFVENRPGAGATIAAREVARSTPDGNTLLFTNTSHSVNPALYGERLPYDAQRDFTPIVLLAQGPSVLIAARNFPANDANGVIALAKAQPGKLEFAVGGFGTSVHMSGELFKSMAHIEILNVPYTGSAPALADVLGGQVQLMFSPVISAVPQVKAGRVKALGITGRIPIPALPGVPPIADSLPGYESAAYFGLLGPAGLPAAVVRSLNASAARVLSLPEVKARLEADGTILMGGSPEAFREFLLADIEKWRKVVQRTGAKPE